MKQIFCSLLFVLAACPLSGQTGAHRIGQVIVKGNGIAANVSPYASIKVCVAGTQCSTISPVYSDQSLTHVLPQPLTADASGNYGYYTSAGCVDEQISSPGSTNVMLFNVCPSTGAIGTGSVNSVSVATVNGFQGTVANPTSTPVISMSVDGSHYLPSVSDESNWNGKQAPLGFTPENAANKDIASGYAGLTSGTLLKASEFPAFTGDASSTAGSTVLTLATVNSGSGVCGDATHICAVTTNAKGLITSQTATPVSSVSTLSVGSLSPLFTSSVANPTSTPAVTFTQSPAPINSVFAGAPSGSAVAPTFQTSPTFSAANLTNFPTFNQNTTGTAANLSGTPALPNGTTATTQTVGDNTTKIATTAFVLANSSTGGVSSINATTGAFTFTGAGVGCTGTTCTFSGTGTGIGSITWALPSWLTATPTTISATGTQTFSATTGLTANQFLATPDGTTGAVGLRAIVPADIPTLNQNTTGTASNLSGTPALPNGTTATTQTVGDNTAKLATTAFVLANAGSMTYPGAGVPVSTGSAWGSSLTAPSGALVGTTDTQTLTNKTVDGVTPTTMAFVDPTSSVQTQLNAKAPLASPALTGVPTAPTATVGTNTTQLATTAFVLANGSSYTLPQATTSVLGGVKCDGTTITCTSGVISTVAGGGNVSTAGLTSGYIPLATSSTAIGNSLLDYGVTTASAFTFAAPVVFNDASGNGGGFDGTEGTAPTGATGVDNLWADSTAHRLKMNNNNGGAVTVASLSDLASSSAFGVVKVDGTSITASGGVISATGSAPIFPWSCQPGLGDGLNAITAGTYLQTSCYNDTGQTVTLTGIKCYTDAGTPTMNVTNGAGTGLLTGAVTCTTSFAAGTQSATTTLAAGDYLKFTFVASGTAKQSTFVVTGTHP